MGFHEVQFPTDISYGSAGGPGFSTSIIRVDSGAEERISRWDQALHRYDLTYAIRDPNKISTVRAFFHARLGAANGFRLKDHGDFTSGTDDIRTPGFEDVVIGTGDASETVFQLVKKYTSGAITRTRTIEKPVSGTVRIGFDGVEQNSGWTVDTSTGKVTFSSAPGNAVSITAGYEFDVPVRFGEAIDQQLPVTFDSFENYSIDALPMVEIRNEISIEDEFYYGGAKDHGSITADVQLVVGEGRVQSFDPDAGRTVILPEADDLPPGGPYFYLRNDSSSNTLDVDNQDGTNLTTIATESTIIVILHQNANNSKIWYSI